MLRPLLVGGAVVPGRARCLRRGGPDSDSAEGAALRQWDYIKKSQFGRSWEELHPAQQELIDRNDFMRCAEEASDESLVAFSDLEILETYEEDIPVPGTDLTVPSVAVTVEITNTILGITGADTLHEIDVDGEWRWILSEPEAYQGENCP